MNRWQWSAVCVVSLVFLMIAPGGAEEIGYLEQFSIGPDREAALTQLVPGTEAYYFYHCLHLQNEGDFGGVENLLKPWIAKYKTTALVRQIKYRQALLTYEADPDASLTYLRNELGLRFDHQRDALNKANQYSSQLDQGLIQHARLLGQAFARHTNLQGLEDRALILLKPADLNSTRRRHLLQRLTRPDYPDLAKLVVADMKVGGYSGFGSYPIHKQMLRVQLDECLALNPALLTQSGFVGIYLSKLHPSNDLQWARDPAQQTAYLDRLWSFVGKLAPVHNSLKAHVLYRRLVLDRSQGIYDAQRFMQYLQLPRNVFYVNPEYLKQDNRNRYLVNFNADYSATTLLPIIGSDEPLIRSYLSHFFTDAADFKAYEPYLQNNYLKEVFAETKITNGVGDPNQWSPLLSAAKYQALRERIDLDFTYTSETTYGPDGEVSLEMDVKNVEKLIVKVYELNAQNFYRTQMQPVSTSINLDGLVANYERSFQYSDSPLRRIRRKFDFPELKDPGVYVVDFIGNGISSRALIHKGRLDFLVRTTTAGHLFKVVDAEKQLVKNSSLWIGGVEYASSEDGEIVVPFSTNPKLAPFVISDGSISTLHQFQHEAEQYRMTAGIYVDRESMLQRKLAPVIVRAGLQVNCPPVGTSVLKDVRLTITSMDLDGVQSTSRVDDFKLHDDEESVHLFRVPQRLKTITFTLSTKVDNLSTGKTVDLSVSESFSINGIEATEKTADAFLGKVENQYVIDLMGRTGEIRTNRTVQVLLKHQDFVNVVSTTLKSNDQGRIMLGALEKIDYLQVTDTAGVQHRWKLERDRFSYYQARHVAVGAEIEIPYMGKNTEPTREELSLFAVGGNSFTKDYFDALKISNGMISIKGLPVGDYDLLLRDVSRKIRILVTDAEKTTEGYLLGTHRHLESKGSDPLQIISINQNAEQVQVQLRGWNQFGRVHVIATRYYPAFAAIDYLGVVTDAEPYALRTNKPLTLYVEGRDIGDEYRYIIDRRYAQKFPGNLLSRPELLLNPWPIRTTETNKQEAAGGEEFEEMAEAQDAMAKRAEGQKGGNVSTGDFSSLNFLPVGSVLLSNLVPNEQGTVEIAIEDLEGHQHLQVIAVDPVQTVYRSASLKEQPRMTLDLRLAKGLAADNHFVQQKQISLVEGDKPFVIRDVTASRFKAYDSLASVHQLLSTLNEDGNFKEFRFVLDWPELKKEKKAELYSKYACHELNFFLYNKDPAFFKTVVSPYLTNKQHKTFMDDWLLDRDLQGYLAPWEYSQLNVVERIMLGRKLAQEKAASGRHVTDMFNLVVPDVTYFNQLFETALNRGGLSANDIALGMVDVEKSLLEANSNRAMDKAEAPGLVGGMGGGGGFGRPGAAPAGEVLGKSSRAADRQLGADLRQNSQLERKKAAKSANGRYLKEDGDGATVDKNENYFYSESERLRAEIRTLYREQEPTREWVENNYYKLPIKDQNAALVTVNAFWNDWARQANGAFRSRNIAKANGNFTEMMLALAVTDLPFKSAEPELTLDGASMKLVYPGPTIMFHEEINATKDGKKGTSVLVSQNFFRHGDRFIQAGNEKLDKFVTEEFLIHTVYGCEVVVTNPTSSKRKLDVLVEIPMGALPVLSGRQTRSVYMELEGYRTQTLEFYFYFPAAGKYPQFPVHVSSEEVLLATGEPALFNVVNTLSQIDKTSWAYISQYGSDDETLEFLRTHNVHQLNLGKIAFRMKDKEMFLQTTALLKSRHQYEHTLWSYSIMHNEPTEINHYLKHADAVVNHVGSYLVSPILTIDPVIRKTYEHMEYRPLVNARAHQLGPRRQILNDRFHAQYHRLLSVLSYKRALTNEDKMAVVYYLLLQDRIAESLERFKQIEVESLATRLQYDYFASYLAMSQGDSKQARLIAKGYEEYPVDRWNRLFAQVVEQVDEINGDLAEVNDPDNREQTQGKLAATEPGFDFKVESGEVKIDYQNLAEVTVNYYEIDIELLFSRNPFVQDFSGGFSFIKPNHRETVKLPGGSNDHRFKLPELLASRNVLVEVVGAGQTQTKAYYSHALAVQIIRNYGHVQVLQSKTRKPLASVYVKVYAQMQDGSVKFYKDGYTDLRGRFDYASLSTAGLDSVTKFSLLISSENNGAMVREATPPLR
ncbi:MAG: hypothetical protein VX738_12505 [Planctomycetota bacterium]|nr:hypothetical protein [Planctomycetota bacterium]